jgi:hypothetical protein
MIHWIPSNADLGSFKQRANLFYAATQLQIQIFSDDETNVIAGREGAARLNNVDLTDITDIILDMSALSVGVSFPLAKLFYESGCRRASYRSLQSNSHESHSPGRHRR